MEWQWVIPRLVILVGILGTLWILGILVFRCKRRRSMTLYDALQSVLARLGRPRGQSIEEKEVIRKLQNVKQLVENDAESEKVLKAICLLLEDGISLGFLYRAEIRNLQSESQALKVRIAARDSELATELRKAEADRKQFAEKLSKWEKQAKVDRKNLQKQVEVDRKNLQKQIVDLTGQVGSLNLQVKRQADFVHYCEWNKIFQMFVAWKIGIAWHRVASGLKQEGNSWGVDAQMHQKVNKVLTGFVVGENKHFGQNHWTLSVHLQDSRNLLCHDDFVRNLQGAALVEAIETELLQVRQRRNRKRRGKALAAETTEFNEMYDDLMENIFLILKSHSSDVNDMKAAQAKRRSQALV